MEPIKAWCGLIVFVRLEGERVIGRDSIAFAGCCGALALSVLLQFVSPNF